MAAMQTLREVVDLTDLRCNQLFNVDLEVARARVRGLDSAGVRAIDGSFAIVAQDGHFVRMARSLDTPLRYFVAKMKDGPALVAANRIDRIAGWLNQRGLSSQFHPSYTRMVPAHHIVEIALVGCPDPNPTYTRFFAPETNRWSDAPAAIGARYARALSSEILAWLKRVPVEEPVGVCFSGGIDSGAVLLLTHHALLTLGMSPSRLKAFTLSVDGDGADAIQARDFVRAAGVEMLLETVEVPASALDFNEAVRVTEDYKPLDIEAATMLLALARGIRSRYPNWTYLLDGDGGDENFKDYPIEENPELTIRSVVNNRMLYHEGWGIDRIKHSLTYSGGLGRACARTYAPLSSCGFIGFSPMTMPNVVEVAEGIRFAELAQGDHDRLYALKGEVVAPGVEAVTGIGMPVFPKRRFQHGGANALTFRERFPADPQAYRRLFQSMLHA